MKVKAALFVPAGGTGELLMKAAATCSKRVFFFFLKSSQQQLSSTFAWQRYHINLTLHNGLFIYNFFSVCAHIHLFLYTSLFNLKEHVSVLERLQPSLATISQDLKEETANKGKQRFIIMIIISRC